MEQPAQPLENQPDVPQSSVPKVTGPKWEPLNATDRRVIGVLIEKAKTTPDAYPMTLNSLCNGCNQKSNRHPVMQLEPDAVEASLDRLRQKGAIFSVLGGGRVEKYRHNMYEWLGVSKQEIAVMGELLLRGDQTQGELRARAARMEPIAGLSELQPIVQALKERGLIISLTSEGRGHVLTHNLYQPQELDRLRAKYADGAPTEEASADTVQDPSPSSLPPSRPASSCQSVPHSAMSSVANHAVDSLQRENEELRIRVADLDAQVADLNDRVAQTEQALRELRDSLGG